MLLTRQSQKASSDRFSMERFMLIGVCSGKELKWSKLLLYSFSFQRRSMTVSGFPSSSYPSASLPRSLLTSTLDSGGNQLGDLNTKLVTRDAMSLTCHLRTSRQSSFTPGKTFSSREFTSGDLWKKAWGIPENSKDGPRTSSTTPSIESWDLSLSPWPCTSAWISACLTFSLFFGALTGCTGLSTCFLALWRTSDGPRDKWSVCKSSSCSMKFKTRSLKNLNQHGASQLLKSTAISLGAWLESKRTKTPRRKKKDSREKKKKQRKSCLMKNMPVR